MISSSEIKFFQKNGYLIKRTNDKKSLDNIQSLVAEFLKKKKEKN